MPKESVAQHKNASRELVEAPTASKPMNSIDAALAVMRADIATGQATKRSLGALYACVMAGSDLAAPGFWKPINEAIMAYGHDGKDQFAYLEGVKKVAWEIFEAAGKGA